MNRYNILHNILKNQNLKIQVNYLFNKQYFYLYTFHIYHPILIPRKTTEIFISLLKYILLQKTQKILDLCSGSGIITASINLLHKNNPICIENNYSCLPSSLKNNNKNNFICDLSFFLLNINKFKIITSNPPYICYKNLRFYTNDYKKKKSLYTDFFGLNNFLNIIKYSHITLTKNNYLIFEHGYNQSKILRSLFKKHGFSNIYTLSDIYNLKRITYAEK